MVNAGSVASPATTAAPGRLARPLRFTATTSLPPCDQLLDDEAADLAGAEDDVPGHDALPSAVARVSGRTAVSAVTTTAPLEPKTVNCSSTSMPNAW